MNHRFTIDEEQRDGEALVVLQDRESGARAAVWPKFGANCVALSLGGPNGRLVQLIAPPESLGLLREQPSRYGMPLLFPWPGRIPAGKYQWRGRTYQLSNVDATGNAMHGLVKNRAWHVDSLAADESCARLRCVISSEDIPEGDEGFPFRWRLAVSFVLGADGFDLLVEVINEGVEPMPFGFGAHPYFELPFAEGGVRDKCRVRIPAGEKWDLAGLREIAVAGWNSRSVRVPLTGEESLREPAALGSRPIDSVLTGLTSKDGFSVCELFDPAAHLTLVVRSSADFESIVLFSPAGRNAFCIEPWTCPPNAFNASELGVTDTGLLVLNPGEEWAASMELSVRAN